MKTESENWIVDPRQVLNETARAVAFLSRMPVPDRFFVGDDGHLARNVRAFPLAGLVIALPGAAALALFAAYAAPPLVAAFVVLSIQALVTGVLHEDGLADTADGLGAGRDRERALAIMKDSRTGVFGAVALILSFGLRASALATLVAGTTPLAAAAAYVGIAAASRAAMAWHWQALPAAKTDGVAAGAGTPEASATFWAIALGVAIPAACLTPALGGFDALVTLAAIAFATMTFTRHAQNRLGGHTGDTIGAAQQCAETIGLAALALCL